MSDVIPNPAVTSDLSYLSSAYVDLIGSKQFYARFRCDLSHFPHSYVCYLGLIESKLFHIGFGLSPFTILTFTLALFV